MLDPELVEASDEDDEYNEGCLSIPGVEGDVFRPIRVLARWRDLEGTVHEEELEGLRARVFQHELDHIDGILFVDRMADATRSRLAGKLNQLRQKTETDLKKA
jgi:peptide deformylase